MTQSIFNTEPITLNSKVFAPGTIELYGDLKISREDHKFGGNWRGDGDTVPAARIWRGKQRMPFVNVCFPLRQKPLLAAHPLASAEARREDYINNIKQAEDRRLQSLAARKTERTSAVNSFAVGDLLKYSWGYDQTNVEFFQVVATTAKTITVRAIAGARAGNCHVTPVPDQFLHNSPPLVRRVLPNNRVRMDHGSASKTFVGTQHYETPFNAGH